jgi:GNAT superfamily N-acetyltransferase
MPRPAHLSITPATEADVLIILNFIKGIAAYEKLSHEVVATEQGLRETLFGPKPYAEVLIARADGEPVGFALFFHNYSTFLGQPGIWLEDLFVLPHRRGQGIGKGLLVEVVKIAGQRKCGRVEWSVLDWNEPSIQFYKSLGAVPMDEWTTFRMTGEVIERVAGIS